MYFWHTALLICHCFKPACTVCVCTHTVSTLADMLRVVQEALNASL